jgi:hypothetical protein
LLDILILKERRRRHEGKRRSKRRWRRRLVRRRRRAKAQRMFRQVVIQEWCRASLSSGLLAAILILLNDFDGVNICWTYVMV